MATQKTTTKAKTKTTKSAARRTGAKTKAAAAKTSRATKSAKASKPAAKKTTAQKTANTAKAVAQVTVDSLRKLNIIKAFVFTALAIAAGFLMNSATYAVNIGYQGKDELLSLTAGKTAFVNASQSVMDVQVRWLVVIILALAAIFALLNATRRRQNYESSLANGVAPSRWLAIGITSALMTEVVALLSGISDIVTLKVVAGIMLITCALAWVAEKRNKQAGRPVWSEYILGLFLGALPWLLIGSYAIATWAYGLIRYSWFVYALYAVVLSGFTLLAINQYKRISGWKNYLVIERNYLLIGLATKAAFAAVLILAFQK